MDMTSDVAFAIININFILQVYPHLSRSGRAHFISWKTDLARYSLCFIATACVHELCKLVNQDIASSDRVMVMFKTPIVRQLIVAGSPQLAALSAGGAVTFPGVLLQQLRANDSSIQLDFDTASWIGSIHGVAGIPSILLPAVMQWKGRKFAFIFACFLIIIGWVLAFTANNAISIIISESFHGLGTNSLLAVSLLSLSEMVAPKYRNISMQMFGIVQSLGMALVGIMVRFVHWRTISLIMCSPVVIALIVACMWPESPSWLACQGEFDKCEKAFTWLRGTDAVSQRELRALITAQKENLKSGHRSSLRTFWTKITSRDFYLPSLHMFLLMNMMYWSGSAVVLIYSIDMIKKATNNENAAFFGGIAINSILFIGVATSGILIKYFNNKSVLLCSTLTATLCLLSVFVASLLQSVGILPKDSLLCSYFLIAFMIPNCLGLNSLVFIIGAELMPVRHRSIGGALFVIFNCTLLATSLKISPYMIFYIDLWGTFLIYTLNATICGLLVWKYVPETKGRTLQEIEDYYIYGSFGKNRETVDYNLDQPMIS